MPQRRCAIKDLRKNHTNRMRNMDKKTDLKKALKSFVAAAQSKAADANAQLNLIYKKLDKAVKTNIISKNTAARRKSRLSKLLANPSQAKSA
ncbi:MAG: 30S ribosomal protein S20 [Candidatus Omnitrophica bacterium CG12_big_fil_rev_8_21_14_0_65_50_5]|nr:MAG: 30S ribosomal protein S20 [Candidatus Omnitrophica bacterium CG12_big_fil_rev_8_21_14_0_65_50_5]